MDSSLEELRDNFEQNLVRLKSSLCSVHQVPCVIEMYQYFLTSPSTFSVASLSTSLKFKEPFIKDVRFYVQHSSSYVEFFHYLCQKCSGIIDCQSFTGLLKANLQLIYWTFEDGRKFHVANIVAALFSQNFITRVTDEQLWVLADLVIHLPRKLSGLMISGLLPLFPKRSNMLGLVEQSIINRTELFKSTRMLTKRMLLALHELYGRLDPKVTLTHLLASTKMVEQKYFQLISNSHLANADWLIEVSMVICSRYESLLLSFPLILLDDEDARNTILFWPFGYVSYCLSDTNIELFYNFVDCWRRIVERICGGTMLCPDADQSVSFLETIALQLVERRFSSDSCVSAQNAHSLVLLAELLSYMLPLLDAPCVNAKQLFSSGISSSKSPTAKSLGHYCPFVTLISRFCSNLTRLKDYPVLRHARVHAACDKIAACIETLLLQERIRDETRIAVLSELFRNDMCAAGMTLIATKCPTLNEGLFEVVKVVAHLMNSATFDTFVPLMRLLADTLQPFPSSDLIKCGFPARLLETFQTSETSKVSISGESNERTRSTSTSPERPASLCESLKLDGIEPFSPDSSPQSCRLPAAQPAHEPPADSVDHQPTLAPLPAAACTTVQAAASSVAPPVASPSPVSSPSQALPLHLPLPQSASPAASPPQTATDQLLPAATHCSDNQWSSSQQDATVADKKPAVVVESGAAVTSESNEQVPKRRGRKRRLSREEAAAEKAATTKSAEATASATDSRRRSTSSGDDALTLSKRLRFSQSAAQAQAPQPAAAAADADAPLPAGRPKLDLRVTRVTSASKMTSIKRTSSAGQSNAKVKSTGFSFNADESLSFDEFAAMNSVSLSAGSKRAKSRVSTNGNSLHTYFGFASSQSDAKTKSNKDESAKCKEDSAKTDATSRAPSAGMPSPVRTTPVKSNSVADTIDYLLLTPATECFAQPSSPTAAQEPQPDFSVPASCGEEAAALVPAESPDSAPAALVDDVELKPVVDKDLAPDTAAAEQETLIEESLPHSPESGQRSGSFQEVDAPKTCEPLLLDQAVSSILKSPGSTTKRLCMDSLPRRVTFNRTIAVQRIPSVKSAIRQRSGVRQLLSPSATFQSHFGSASSTPLRCAPAPAAASSPSPLRDMNTASPERPAPAVVAVKTSPSSNFTLLSGRGALMLGALKKQCKTGEDEKPDILFPTLIGSQAPISSIVDDLKRYECGDLVAILKDRGIENVGDLAKMLTCEVAALPIKFPPVATAKYALSNFLSAHPLPLPSA